MTKKYLTLSKVAELHQTISFLDSYTPVVGETHHIGNDINTVDVENTKLLNELGEINVRRKQIIEILCPLL